MGLHQFAKRHWLCLALLLPTPGCGGDGEMGSGDAEGMKLPASPAPPTAQPDVSASQPSATQSASTGRDGEVLNAVFADLLTRAGSPLAVRHQPPAQIRFLTRPATLPRSVEQLLKRRDAKAWAALTPQQVDAAMDAAGDLVRRHRAGEGLGAFSPRDERVKVETESPAAAPATRRSRFDRPVVAHPPGYAPNGDFAAVSLVLPWSMHWADATYLLAREGGEWRVVLRQFAYYY